MHILFIISAIGLPLVTWWHWRSLIHPCVAISIVVSVLLVSDIAVRGNDDASIRQISPNDLVQYQILLLCAAVGMVVTSNITAVCVSAAQGSRDQKVRQSLLGSKEKLQEFLRLSSRIGWGILGIEIFKILHACGWSIQSVSDHFFGGYAVKPWEMNGNVGGLHSLYQITRIILPFAGLGFASGLLFGTGSRKIASYLGLATTFGLMFSHGSKTPIFATMGFMMVGFLLKEKNFIKRATLVGATVVFLAAVTSVLYQHRSAGLKHASIEDLLLPKIHYRQDDGAYRALRCMDIANHSDERWDAGMFFITTIVNPIPRYFWPDKPILLKSYWGSYKVEWVTITAVGEFTAMFGADLGCICTVIAVIPLTLLLCRYHSRIAVIPDVFIYLVICLYCYMIIRSLLNIGMYIYLPAFAMLFQRYITRRAAIIRPRQNLRLVQPMKTARN